MNELSPDDAAKLAFVVIQKLRSAYKDNKQFSLATAATLTASLANPGIRQGDVVSLIGGLQGGAVSKQLDILEARDGKPGQPRFVYKTRNELNRKENDIIITEEGERFKKELATLINKTLRSSK